MAPQTALRGLARALHSGLSSPIVADVDWDRFRSGLLDGLSRTPLSAPGLPENALRTALLEAPASERLRRLSEVVAGEVAAVLAIDDPSALDAGKGFRELGLDSLSAVALKGRLEQRTGVRVPVTLVFDRPTVDEAAAWLLEQLAPELSATRAAEVTPAAATEEAIAIVGVGLRLPGGATDLESLWEVLSEGRETVRPIPQDRFDMSPWYDPDPGASGKSYVRQAALLDDVRGFDAAFFGISPKEAAPMDPQHRLLLEASWAALEHAGLPPASLRGTATGVFAGVGANEYERSRGRTVDEADAYYVTGSHTSFAAGRIAYHLGLQGPVLTVDTACSSSLVALHLACNALRRGECDVALAAGAQVLASPMAFVMLSKTQALAPDGRSKTFSENADGYGRGEGVGVLVLQRLRDVKPGEGRVLGLVRGTAVNHDGASSGITAPNGTAQQRVLRAALRDAGLSASAVDVVECHGTGTKLGDPIEVVALSGVYGEGRSRSRPLQIGAAKTNLGHLEAAAGVVGVLKMLAAFRHQALPPTLHSSPANSHIPWSELALEVTTVLTPWPTREDGQPRRAGVSAFGLSGTNAHVILEEPPPSAPLAGEAPLLFPLVLSAKSSEALEAEAGRWSAWLARNPAARASDVVYRAAAERTHFSERASILAESPAGWSTALSALAAGAALPPGCWRGAARGKLAVLFTGQGSQRAGMGRALYERLPVFRRALDEIVRALEAHLESSLLPVLFADAGTAEAARLEETELAQPALFALEVALFRLWQSWGLRPDVLLGHSIGELVAAHVGSVLSLSDAARLVVARGRLMQSAEAGGAMVAIGAGWEEVSEELERWKSGARLGLAAHNGPRETVISGDAAAVLSAAEVFAKRGHRTTRLAVSHAFHSAHMDSILEAFQAVAAQCRFEAPTIPIISNLSGRRASSAELRSPEYWTRQLRGAVRFYDGVRFLHEQERVSTFLECGPQGVLSAMGASCLAPDAATFIPSLRRDQDEPRHVLGALSAVYAAGHDVDWAEVLSELPDPRPVDLPSYAFLRSPHWLETGTSIPRAPGGAHPLLGVGRRIPGADLRVHSSQISARSPSWIPDHVVMGQVLLPGAAFAELLLCAGAGSTEPVTLAQVLISAPLHVPSTGDVALEVTVEAAKDDGLRRVRVHSAGLSKLDEDPFKLHAEASLLAVADPAPSPVLTLPPPGSRELERSSAELYQALASHGLRYGPSFQGLRRAWTSGDEVWGELELPATTAAEADRYGLHPALLDAATHAIAVAAQGAGAAPGDVYLPLGMERLTRWRSGERRLWVRVKLGHHTPEVLRATLSLFASDGAPVAEIQGLELRRADRSSLLGLGETALDRLQFGVEWRAVELEQSAPRTRFGFLTQGPAAAWVDALQASLASLGVERVRSVEEVVERGLGGLIAAWPSGADTIGEAHRIAAEGLAQLQRLAAVPGLRVVWVTRDAVRSRADDHVRGLAASALWGLGRAARIEQASLSLTMLDVGEDPPSAARWSAILQSSREPELSLRGGLLWSPRLVRAAPAAASQRRTGKEQTVLLTGAFGGLGRQVARWLVQERGVQHLLLTRRPGLASPAVASLTQELCALGAEVQVAPCDVTDREALAAVLRAIPPERPLRGIIHAAGVLDDGLLALLTPERLARVLSPKIDGAYNLHTLTADEPLEFFVLFSSVAGLFGSAGQSNYSAANSFLDALASHRRAQGLAGQSIAWGPWSEGGMASALSEAHQARLLRQGLEPLSPSQGLSLLGAALDSEDELFVALDLDARRLAQGLEQSRRAPPALIRALLPGAAIREDQAAALWARIRALPPAERPRALREVVQGEVATVLGLAQAQQVKPAEPLLELGIDSLSAVELRNRLAALVGVELSATLVFDYPTADALALLLLDRSGLGGPVPSAAPAREDVITERIDALSDEEVGQELDALLGD